MISAVLWDNDGVLVDTETAFFDLTRDAFAAIGLSLTPEHWMKEFMGRGMPSRAIAAAMGAPDAAIERVLEDRNATFRRILEAGVQVQPGVRETLASLRGRVRLAIVTSAPADQLQLIHRSTGLLPFFDSIVTADDCARTKPWPDGYLVALERLGLRADECVAVEDSARGVAAARAAGLRCVLVPHALTDVPACAGAWRVEPDVTALVGLLPSAPGARS
jgi:HAD superfamily hydrolase (TIGR01509 family)